MFQDRTTSRQHIIRFTSVSIETSCRLYFEDTGTVPSRGKSARISYPSFLPEKFGQEFMLPNKKFEAGGGKEWRKSDGREGGRELQ